MRIAAAGLAATVMLAVPATALADQPSVTPTVNCVTVNKDGSIYALFGYSNSGPKVTLKRGGPDNSIDPSNLEGPEPDTFMSGTVYGAFVLAIPAGGTATWVLHGHRGAVANAKSPLCGKPIQLPQEGNGLGLVLGLIAAGLAGTVLIRRVARLPDPRS